MYDLQLVGVHDDGEHLVLTGGDGQRYRVRVDERLRAAVRRDRTRLGQIQIEGAVRPRDIQARIRGGESAEHVAETSGLPLEHVRRYEGPVLAEREHVADLARRLPARQVPERPAFGDLVAERLAARGVAEEPTGWDAWRRDGSTWTVQLSFRAGSRDRLAQWAFDVQRSHLEPLDDEARWLSAAAGAEGGPLPGRRLATVSERVYDVEADGGVRPAVPAGRELDPELDLDLQPEPGATREGAGGPATLDLIEALRGRRGRRQPAPEPTQEPVQEPAEEPAGEGAGPGPRRGSGQTASGTGQVEAATAATAAPAAAVALEDEPVTGQGPGAEDGAAPQPPPRQRKASKASKSRRASVPSWDDIVFGAKRE